MAAHKEPAPPQLEVITTDSESPVRCFISEDHGSFVPYHYHPAVELIYVLEGSMCFSLRRPDTSMVAADSEVAASEVAAASASALASSQQLVAQLPPYTPTHNAFQPIQPELAGAVPAKPAENSKSTSFMMLGNSAEPVHRDFAEPTSSLDLPQSQAVALAQPTAPSAAGALCTKTHDGLKPSAALGYDQELTAQGHNCVLFNSNELHATQCPEFNRSLVLQIPFDFLVSNLGISANHNVQFALSKASVSCLSKMQEALAKLIYLTTQEQAHKVVFAKEIYFRQALYTIMECLLEVMVSVPQAETQATGEQLSKQRILPVLEQINQCYASEMSLPQIAATLHIHPNYFCRMFKQVVGQSFLAYLTEVRLCHVYQDLISTHDNIAEVAARNGLVYNNYFCKIFKQRFLMTPSELRKRHWQHNEQ